MRDDALRNLLTERNRIADQARSIITDAERERRDLTAAESAQLDRIYDRIDTLKQIESDELHTRSANRERDTARSAYEPLFRDGLGHRDRQSAHDVLAFFRGEVPRLDLDLSAAWREKRLIRSGADARELRDLTTDVAAAGGYAVPTSFHRELVDYIEFFSGARQLNVTQVTTASGEALQVPKVTAHGTAVIRGEGTAIAEADAAFGQTTLYSWKYGVLTQVSSELLTDSGVDMLGFIARDTARAIARVTDTDFVTGSGTNKPQGIMTTMPVGATVQTGSTGVPNLNNLLDVLYSVNPPNRAEGAMWFTSDLNVRTLRKLTDTTGRPLWEPNTIVGQPDLFFGYPIIESSNVTTFATAGGTHLAFGNFAGYFIRDAGPLRFEQSRDFAFSSDLVTYRTLMRTDGRWVDTASNGVKFLKAPTS